MIIAIVFSYNRACQLDLLLSSLADNAPDVFDLHVLWRAKDSRFQSGYEICERDYPDVKFIREDGLTYQVRHLLKDAERVAFFTDDDVLYRPVSVPEIAADTICFSLRLGLNTKLCYPHARTQKVPRVSGADEITWSWHGADGDFSYPMSLDGHIFRADDLIPLLVGRHFSGPNFLEETLARGARLINRPLMSAHRQSSLVGIPINRVNTTTPNRHGELHPRSVEELNEQYLEGKRIYLRTLDVSNIVGAHQEMELTLT